MIGRAIAIWLVVLVLAVLNGALRETLIRPWSGERSAHVASTLILCVAIFIVASLTIRWIGANSGRDALLIGVLWIVLTVAFEFLAGHYLFGTSWETLLADYNILQGRIWVLVLRANLFAPLWAFSTNGS